MKGVLFLERAQFEPVKITCHAKNRGKCFTVLSLKLTCFKNTLKTMQFYQYTNLFTYLYLRFLKVLPARVLLSIPSPSNTLPS